MLETLKRNHRRGTCHWRDLILALGEAEFSFLRNSASHAIYLHRPTGHTVAVLRGGRDVANGTLAKLIREVRDITGLELSL